MDAMCSGGSLTDQRGFAYYQLPSARAMMIQSPPLMTMDDEVCILDRILCYSITQLLACILCEIPYLLLL